MIVHFIEVSVRSLISEDHVFVCKGYRFIFFYDFSIKLWKCFDTVIFFVSNFIAYICLTLVHRNDGWLNLCHDTFPVIINLMINYWELHFNRGKPIFMVFVVQPIEKFNNHTKNNVFFPFS